MFLYNVHTPSRTFALTYKEGEKYDALLDRIAHKAHLEPGQTKALKNRRDGGLVYEYEGEKYSLEEDDDLEILLSRLPPSSTSSTTLHLSVPSAASSHPHAHFAPSPPSYSTAADGIKNKAQKSQAQTQKKQQQPQQQPSQPNGSALKTKDLGSAGKTDSASLGKPVNGHSHGSSTGTGNGNGGGVQGSLRGSEGFTPTSWNSKARSVSGGEAKTVEHTADGTSVGMVQSASRPKSVTSTRSRRSKYGGDPNAEPWADVHKRNWEAFQAGSGVRTVVGEIAGVPDVRMLLKSGYKGVYISRTFAVKTGIVSAKFGMGSFGYTGLKAMGNVSITVGSKTVTHPAMISEEQHFDVVLGRQWLEKVGVKVDPIDQTMLTYMDSGEVISCDIVVLKDDKGNKIFVT